MTLRNLTVAGNKFRVTVQDLEVNALYEFKVAGFTKDGIGPYSDKIAIKLSAPTGKYKLSHEQESKTNLGCFTYGR